MLTTLILLSLLPQIHYGITLFHACIPNSQFHVNGRLCFCDATGRWSETNCEISRRQACKPGQIIWEDCSQCICQENGHLTCTNTMCGEEATFKPSQINKAIDVTRLWCIPFVSYYLNCSLCVCPASGKMNEARCASDATCPFLRATDYLAAVKNNVCIPKVMYLFPCLHCLCSDDGFFIVSKCVETCQKTILPDVARICIPRTFYRKDCNVCFCPDNSIRDENLCTKTTCSHRITPNSLVSLRNKSRRCRRQTFTGTKCFYCECNLDGTVNENACLELDCMSIDDFKYNFNKPACSPGEMVPKCIECFCLRNGVTDPKYCTEDCSNEQKILILENAIQESFNNRQIVDRKAIKKTEVNEVCDSNSIYKEQERYCLCTDNEKSNFKLCTSVIEERYTEKSKISKKGNTVDIDFNVKCDPNTFVEFDCNTCYCLKTGRIDPKWCTYDDCESKRTIIERQKNEKNVATIENNGACSPGSISKEECNFCICPDNGQLKDKACTKNSCAGVHYEINNALACEPLTYYTVDCNVCYCPKNGVKNVAKCTKNTCEKNFLRSEVCVAGRLFSVECNVCVCPPNGDKSDRVCSNNTCSDSDAPWKQIFQLSQNLMSYQNMGDTTRNLELCFPGEEFEVGCKVCLCPDMGLRVYATCTQMLCDNEKSTKQITSDSTLPSKREARARRTDEDCLDLNYFDSSEVKECTPGSMYIIRCQQCICPYMGNINHFCRPMPVNEYCEQAYPNINYLPMGKKTDDKDNKTTTETPKSTVSGTRTEDVVTIPHPHTAWACDAAGRLMDECFICECQNNIIIQEHCFKNKQKNCTNSKPTFLKTIKLPER